MTQRTVPAYKAETTCDFCLKIIPVGSQAFKERNVGDNWGWYCNEVCQQDQESQNQHRAELQIKQHKIDRRTGVTDHRWPDQDLGR